MRVEDLLTRCDHVFVAFDGPIAELPSMPVADRLRVLMGEIPLPRKVARTDDPFAVLAHAATIGPATERAVYAQLCRVEYELTGFAHRTDGVAEALAFLAAAGTRVTVVSGMHTAAVRSFLVVQGLSENVHHLAARDGTDPAVLPLITAVLHDHAVTSCAFVGSTRADLTAARAAGVTAVRHRRPADEPAPQDPWFGVLSQPSRRLL